MNSLRDLPAAGVGILIGAIAGVVAWALGTFATIPYVDAKHSEAMGAIGGTQTAITDIKDTLKVIDERTWEMSGRKAPMPKSLENEF